MFQKGRREMKKTFVIFFIAAWVFLGLSSEAFCARGGPSGGGPRVDGSPGGGRSGTSDRGYRGGGYRGGGYHRGGSHFYFGGYFGFPFYAYPYGYYPFSYYPYGYPYSYPYAYPAYPYAYPDYSNTYDQPTIYSEPEQTYSWYYCRDPEGYYPYVTSCPGGWTKVVPTPPGEEGVTR
jgi:hypothetical protein